MVLKIDPREKQMQSKSWLKIVLVTTAIILLTSCGPGGSSKKYKLAFLTNNADDFWTVAHRGCEQAGRELSDVDVEFRIPSDGTAAEQRRIVDELVTKGVAGLA